MEHQQKKEMAHMKQLVSVLDPKKKGRINDNYFLNDLTINFNSEYQ